MVHRLSSEASEATGTSQMTESTVMKMVMAHERICRLTRGAYVLCQMTSDGAGARL